MRWALLGWTCHGGRRGPGRPPRPGPGHRRPGAAPTRRGRAAPGRRGSGRRREPVLAPPQPGGRRRSWPGCAGTPRRCCTTTTCPGSVRTWPTCPPPPDDPAWAHVTINELSRRRARPRGMTRHAPCTTPSTPTPAPGERDGTRRALGVRRRDAGCCSSRPGPSPARTWPAAWPWPRRSAPPTGSSGPAEDGYGPELERLVAAARCPVLLGPRAAGGVRWPTPTRPATPSLLPSTWEGFGNPSVESATHRRPLAIGPYPVAAELAAFGFRWFDRADPGPLGRLARPPGRRPARRTTSAVARRHFNLADLPGRLAARPRRPAGWRPGLVTRGR